MVADKIDSEKLKIDGFSRDSGPIDEVMAVDVLPPAVPRCSSRSPGLIEFS